MINELVKWLNSNWLNWMSDLGWNDSTCAVKIPFNYLTNYQFSKSP